MFNKCLHIMVVFIFALSAMAAAVQAASTYENQMVMESGVPCDMPCNDKNNQSDDDNCCIDGAICTSVSVSAMFPVVNINPFPMKEAKYPILANESLESFSPEALKSPPKHLS